jgi:hypothetical protein
MDQKAYFRELVIRRKPLIQKALQRYWDRNMSFILGRLWVVVFVDDSFPTIATGCASPAQPAFEPRDPQ